MLRDVPQWCLYPGKTYEYNVLGTTKTMEGFAIIQIQEGKLKIQIPARRITSHTVPPKRWKNGRERHNTRKAEI